jgi:hypothetical protein
MDEGSGIYSSQSKLYDDSQSDREDETEVVIREQKKTQPQKENAALRQKKDDVTFSKAANNNAQSDQASLIQRDDQV